MIEIVVLNHLTENLDVPCMMEHKGCDGSYVVIEKTAGGIINKGKYATFAIQSNADSMYSASVLNELVKDAMFKMAEIDSIGSVKLNSDYNFTDTTTKKYRYQSVFNITYMEG